MSVDLLIPENQVLEFDLDDVQRELIPLETIDDLIFDAEEEETDPRVKPHPLLEWQEKPWNDKSLIVVISGSAGGGKSHICAQKIVSYLERYPNTFGLLLRKTRQSLTSSTILYLEENIIPNWEALGYKDCGHEKTNSRFKFPNGSYLAYAGLGTREERTRLRSIGKTGGVSIIWIEEATELTEEDFNEAIARLRDKYAPFLQVILSTNPDHAEHWIKKKLIDTKKCSLHLSSRFDNPHNHEQYSEMLENLTGVQYLRLVKGQWVSAEGVIFSEYDPTKNLTDSYDLPKEGRRIVGIDFGVENPTAVQWWWIHPSTNDAYMYREFYKTHADLEGEVCDLLLKYDEEEDIEVYIADHNAAERKTLAKRGIATLKAKKDILYGIGIVNRKFKEGKIKIMADALVEEDQKINIGKPRCWVQELGSYVWSKPSATGRDRKDVPVDENNHGCDVSRYVHAYLERGVLLFR